MATIVWNRIELDIWMYKDCTWKFTYYSGDNDDDDNGGDDDDAWLDYCNVMLLGLVANESYFKLSPIYPGSLP